MPFLFCVISILLIIVDISNVYASILGISWVYWQWVRTDGNFVYYERQYVC
jgi:hypothetical protein